MIFSLWWDASDELASDDVITSGALCLQKHFDFRSSSLQRLLLIPLLSFVLLEPNDDLKFLSMVLYTWTNISISNWQFLIPCYHQNSKEVMLNTFCSNMYQFMASNNALLHLKKALFQCHVKESKYKIYTCLILKLRSGISKLPCTYFFIPVGIIPPLWFLFSFPIVFVVVVSFFFPITNRRSVVSDRERVQIGETAGYRSQTGEGWLRRHASRPECWDCQNRSVGKKK